MFAAKWAAWPLSAGWDLSCRLGRRDPSVMSLSPENPSTRYDRFSDAMLQLLSRVGGICPGVLRDLALRCGSLL